MTLIRNGLIGSIGGAGVSTSTQLALAQGLACFAQSFSGVTTTSFTHGLGTSDLVVEFQDTSGNLLVPDNWTATNNNVLSVEFPTSSTGRVTIVGCIASGIAASTGGVTSVEGLSGIIDLDCPDGSTTITTSGQVINICALFTPASGAVLEQKCRDIDILSGLIGVGDAGQTSINGLSGTLSLTSPDNTILIGDGPQAIELSGLFTQASGAVLEQKCEDILTLSGLINNISGITAQQQVFYFGKHGNDNNSGRSVDDAFLTISGAITAATGELLNSENFVELVCHDGGLYEEDFTIPQWVSISAPGAIVSGAIELGNNSAVRFHTVRGDGATVISKTVPSGAAYLNLYCLETAGSSIALSNAAADSILVAEIDHVELIDGTGVVDASTGFGHSHIQIEDFNIAGTGSALDITTAGGEIVGNIGTIHEIAGATAVALLMTADGVMNLNIREIDTTFAYAISTGSLNMFVNNIEGSQIAVAPARACVITPCLLTDLIEGSGVRSLNGASGVVDLVSPDESINITTNGQVIELTAIQKAARTFTPASGVEFVLQHGLNTEDWTWSMWKTDGNPMEILLPDNVYPSGSNHAVVQFQSSDVSPSGYNGKIVFVG